jgi:4-amino-4-deoxy-L-arabinose transferase-like glycosyltransferase
VLGLAAAVLLLSSLFRGTGGLVGRYYVRGDAGEILVHERLDPRIDFPVPQRLDAAYIFHWDERRFGFPYTMPPYLVRWRGFLAVPQQGRYGFSAEANGHATVRLDGQPLDLSPDVLTDRHLEAGLHPVEIDYELAQGDAKLVLRWQPPGKLLRPIPADYLAADGEALRRGRARRAAGWTLLAFAAGATVLLAARARRPGSVAARLAGLVAAERTRLALGAILILAAALRFHDYALVPFHHETADEYQHAWEGWHLLHEGVPAAWSTFPDRYPIARTVDFRWFGDRYVLVKPYFDHPPLFSILVGLVNSLAGQATYPVPRDFLFCSLPVMRLVPIVLSLLGLFLVHRLARAYGATEEAALLAALVYAILPVIVLSHRLVKGESLLSLLFMGAILAADRHGRTGARRDAIVAGVLCGLSIWTKATGVAVLATVLILMMARRRFRGAAIAAGLTGGFLALYLLYAWAYDFGIFVQVIRAQATSKWVSLDSILDLLAGKVVVKWFGRGWYLWLLLCAGVAAFRKERSLLLPLAIYGTIIALTADHRVVYGWYRIPLYPFLCVAAGIYLEEMRRESNLFAGFPFAASAVATGLLYALPAPLADNQAAVALFALVALGPYLARLVHEGRITRRLAEGATYVLMLLFLLTSVAAVESLLEIYAATRGTLP